MKKIFLLGLLACAFAGNPDQAVAKASNPLTFQGSLKSVDGQAVTKTMNMTFKIYNQEAGGAPIWAESNAVAVNGGFFNVYLGNTQDLDIDFSQECWLEITLDNGDVLPRTRMTATPFSFQAGIASTADTATLAMDVIDGVLTWDKFNADAKIAGGVLTGTYPNPSINTTVLVDELPQYGIPGDKITPGTYTHISTAPAGPAFGDLEGSNFPNLYIAPGKITNEHLQAGAVKALNLSSDGANADQVLIPDGNGGVVWADVPSPLNRLGNGTTYGQMFFWNGSEWEYTHNVAPRNGQVLKFDENVGLFRWMDDDGFSIPYINDNVATLNEDVIRIQKTDGSLGNMLELTNLSSQGQEVVALKGQGDRAFDNGVLHVDATTNNNIQGESKAASFHQTVSTDSNTGSAAVEATNTIENCTICDNCTGTGSEHDGVNAQTTIAGALGQAVGVRAAGNGGFAAKGVFATANGAADKNIGIEATANGGNRSVGVLAYTGEAPVLAANAAVYAKADGNAVYATGNATGSNYVAQVKNTNATNGRALNAEAAPANQTGFGDANAVAVLNNLRTDNLNAAVVANGGAGKTALKTYGDIWADGAMGANAVITPQVVVGDLDNNSKLTLDNNNLYVSTGATFNGDVNANNFNAANGVTVGDPAIGNGTLTVNGTSNLNGTNNFNGTNTLNNGVTINGTTTANGPINGTAPITTTAIVQAPTFFGTTYTGINGATATFIGDLQGNAATATLATNATHATNADNATNATHATNADNATNATHATNADNATNATNAAHATNADNATNATNAAHATNADNATNATNAAHVPATGVTAGAFGTGVTIPATQVTGLTELVTGTTVTNAVNAVNAGTANVANTVNTTTAGSSIIDAINNAGGINIDKAHLPETIAYEDENNSFIRNNRFEGITELAGTTNVSNQLNISGNTVISGTTVISTPNATVTGVLRPVSNGIVAANEFIADPAGTALVDLSEMAAPTNTATDAQFIQWNAATNAWEYTTINMSINAGSVGSDELADMTTITAGAYGDGSNVPVITVDQDGRVSGISTTPVVENDPKVGNLTSGKLPLWGTDGTLIDSKLTEDGLGLTIAENVTVNGNLNVNQSISGAIQLSNAVADNPTAVNNAVSTSYKSIVFYSGTEDINLPALNAADAGRLVYIAYTGTAAPNINGQGIFQNQSLGFVWSGAAWIQL